MNAYKVNTIMNKQTGCNELIYANERITHTAKGSMNAFGNRHK